MNGAAPSRPEILSPLPAAPNGPPVLCDARAHEVVGDAARAFAAAQAGARQGPVVWIETPRVADGRGARLDPYGLTPLLDPSRLILIDAPSAQDVFWAMEEVLRSGGAPTVIGAAGAAADLTQSRRLQLAAEAGAAATDKAPAPLALLITPDGRQSPAAETRWRAQSAPSWRARPGAATAPPRWIWTLLKNKRGPLGAWTVDFGPLASWSAAPWSSAAPARAQTPPARAGSKRSA